MGACCSGTAETLCFWLVLPSLVPAALLSSTFTLVTNLEGCHLIAGYHLHSQAGALSQALIQCSHKVTL